MLSLNDNFELILPKQRQKETEITFMGLTQTR